MIRRFYTKFGKKNLTYTFKKRKMTYTPLKDVYKKEYCILFM